MERRPLILDAGVRRQMRAGDVFAADIAEAIHAQLAEVGSTIRAVQSGNVRESEAGEYRELEAATWA